jgi:RNA polymerase sigma-70 factor (ECF subfamily)
MTAALELADRFEALRPRLLRLAYGHLGSLAEAEDVLQDAWLRLQRVDAAEIRDLQGWLTTVVSRLALDALRSARVRREAYVGPWLPEPVVQEPGWAGGSTGLESRAEQAEDVSLALLVVLESLSASERIAFVLHDVFGYSFDEVSAVLGTSSVSARQHASRARKAVEARRPRFPATPEQQRDVIVAFRKASREGDIAGLLSLLHPDVVFTSDGGGRVRAARKPIEGADRVARLSTALAAKGAAGATWGIVDINGLPGWMGVGADGAVTVMSFTVDDGRIVAIDVQRNPEKLRRLPAAEM